MNREKSGTKRGVLGKGISSLLGGLDDEVDENPNSVTSPTLNRHKVENEIVRLDIGDVMPNPSQPRKLFDEQALHELSTSLKQDGFLQPIVVTSMEDEPGKYMIIAGERRWRASRLAGFETVPAVIKEGVSDDMLRLALIENIQRADLNVIEEAEAYASLIEDYGLTQEMCAAKVGKERSTVANALRLLALPRLVQDSIIGQEITMGHGRALLSLEEEEKILNAYDQVLSRELTVRQTEALCKELKRGKESQTQESAVEKDQGDLDYVAERLRSSLQTKVRLVGSASKGKIEISYFSNDDLERLTKILGFDM